jgi:alpha-tubulin suppressor-like RCC1 family protein
VRIYPDLQTTKNLGSAAAGGSAGTLTVLVTDQFGNIVTDTVNFADQVTGGGVLSDTLVVTSASGQASSTWTLGPRIGLQTIRARLANRPASAPVIWSDTGTVQFSDIAVGNFHVCGLSATARIYCWGLGDVGQLGKGSFNSTTMPSTAVAMSADSSATANTLRARQVSGSRSSICVVTLANQVFCWGKGWGSLATSILALAANVQASGGSGTILGIADYQVAEDHACLIQTSGIANCTGNNDHGQMGDKSAGPPFPSPSTGTWPWVDAQLTYSTIRLGTSFSCGFHRYRSEGSALVPDSSQVPLCWGDGTEGQRGDSITLNGVAQAASTPKHIKVKSLPLAIAFDSLSLAVGDKHACAAAVTTGIAYCWGLNAHGQLGRATTGLGNAARDSAAAAVTGSPAFVRLYAGKYHTCGLTSDGTPYCWGRNDSGQLGIGSVTAFNTGVNSVTAVSTSLKFRNLSLGELSTCGVTGTPGTAAGAGSRVYCWGDNSFGQLGTGSTTAVLTPAKVNGQP